MVACRKQNLTSHLFALCLKLVAGVPINNKATRCDYTPYWSVSETVVRRRPCILICLTANRWGTNREERGATLNLNYSKAKITGAEDEITSVAARWRGHHQLIHSSLRRHFPNAAASRHQASPCHHNTYCGLGWDTVWCSRWEQKSTSHPG